MSIDEIVRRWKSDEDASTDEIPANPVGEELSDKELQDITGGMWCVPIVSCVIHLSQ